MVAPHKSRLVPATSTKDENQITAKDGVYAEGNMEDNPGKAVRNLRRLQKT
jgi:hypothetical protein